MLNNFSVVKRITPVISAAAYGAGDQIGPDSTALEDVAWGARGVTRIVGVKVLDKAKQKAAIDLYFFNSEPTVASGDNDAFDVSDAEMAAKFVGVVSVAAADYKDIANNSAATVIPAAPIAVQCEKNTASPSGKGLWVSLVSRGTPTYASTSDLVIEIQFE